MTAHPVLHALHDIGLATWSGGSLMGAVGLNGAAAAVDDPAERSRVSTRGWSRYAPVYSAGLGAHLVGAAGLLLTDLARVKAQEGVARSSAVKTAATAAGLGVAAWSGVLNRKMAASTPAPVKGATEPSAATPPDIAKTQRQLKVVQWLNPAIAFGLIAITDWQEEQQRASQEVQGVLKRSLSGRNAAIAGLALGGLALARRRSSGGSSSTSGHTGTSQATPVVDLVEVDVVEVDLVDTEQSGTNGLGASSGTVPPGTPGGTGR